MLVLTRKQNEKIQIGDEITVTVLRMKGKTVRLGIEAPAHVNLLRGELAFELDSSDIEEPEKKAVAKTVPRKIAARESAEVSNQRQQPASAWPTSTSCNPDQPGPLRSMIDTQ